ncbi:MAG: DNA polymerase I [Paludibacteraceae bacterium]|nr:DNA polymerase I [Paludibacteraceae bacterium]
MKSLLLIDAYAMIYRAYYAFIKNPRINSKGLNTSSIYGFVNILEDLLKRLQPTHVGVAFDPAGKTFRHEAYAEYKAQREATPEDIKRSIPYIKSIIQAYRIPILEVEGFEADDVIGTLAHKAAKEGFEVFMATPDKDYGQLLTEEHIYMYRPRHSGGFEQMSAHEVCEKYGIARCEQMIDLLGLMGDSSDNIPGCPGVGEKTAVKLLNEFGSISGLLENVQELKGALRKKVEDNRELILFSQFLATIRKDVPIEFNAEELMLATPDKTQLIELYSELEFRQFIAKLQPAQPIPVAQQMSLFDVFEEGNNASEATKVESVIASFDPTKVKYTLLDTPSAQEQFVVKLLQQPEVCFDTETTSVNAMEAELVGMSFSWNEGEAYYLPVPEDNQVALSLLQSLRPFFESDSIVKVGQNMKYDLLVLRQYGIEVQGTMFDTMIAHYLLQPDLRHGMDYLAEIYLNYQTIHYEDMVGKKGKNQLSIREVEPSLLANYACEDADITLRLKKILQEEIESKQLHQLMYEVEMPLMRVLVEMEWAGVYIDTKTLSHSSEVLSAALQQLEEEIYYLAGEKFNINSPKQVGDILFEKLQVDERVRKTKNGQYSTSEEVLESLRHKHVVVQKILDYRELKKLLSTYVDALPLLINQSTGRIHTSYNQTVAVTGRLSSSNPNLQNIPIRTESGRVIREAFVANEGCVFLSADYSQIELRIMAHLSQDANMLEAFRRGVDIHAATAAKIYNIPLEQVTSDMRRKAKTANFGIIYGISAFGLSERLGISRTEAKDLIDGYFAAYPSIKQYIDTSIAKAREQSYVETLLGRKRFLPDIQSRNSVVRGFAERNAVNAPIQGTAADIIKIAMIRISHALKANQLKATMNMQVHDELNFSVPVEELEQVKRIVMYEMEHAMKLTVPLIVECGVGNNWLEAH